MRAMAAVARFARDPLWLSLAVLAGLVFGMASAKPLFAAFFPELERPLYEQDSFLSLIVAHLTIVGLSSLAAILVGCSLGIFVTRTSGKEFRGLLDTLIAIGQTVPPVAVLAIAVPFIGFGIGPALIALFLYSLLPIVEGTIAGLTTVSPSIREAAQGMGWKPPAIFLHIELPLAAPVILAGIRTSFVINIGTAAVASAVGATTLGSPIIIGLSGFNTAYVIQGALVIGALAVVADQTFERLGRWLDYWKTA